MNEVIKVIMQRVLIEKVEIYLSYLLVDSLCLV